MVSFIKDFNVDRKVVHSVKLLTAQRERCFDVVFFLEISRLIALIRDENSRAQNVKRYINA